MGFFILLLYMCIYIILFFSNRLPSTLFCVSYSVVVRKSCTLRSGPYDVPSMHLAPYIVVMILLTTFSIIFIFVTLL